MYKAILLASAATGALLFAPHAFASTVVNPICPDNTALFDPGNGQDITVPPGYQVSVFKSGLNFPTGIAFRGDANQFEVYVLESGHGLPSICNEQGSFGSGDLDPTNPFTPDVLVFDQDGNKIRGPLAKPTAGGGLQSAGPAVDLAFEQGLKGGRLFATDSNQATHASGQNNSSRIVMIDPDSGDVTAFITNLPTGDHPSEQLAFRDGWIYWSQGSTTNSGVVGLDNGGGTNQQDIPCRDITLSDNLFDSGNGVKTSGYSPFGTQRPGAVVKAFESASHQGVCDGAILRARLHADHPENTIEPYSWGYRNGYAIRFSPRNHALGGELLVGEDGADERGARPSNNAPDNIQLARKSDDGGPDYHGWPDQYGFLPSSQAVYNPVGGPGDDLCVPDPTNLPSTCTPDSLAQILSEDVPIKDVLAAPPQDITSPIATEAADSSFTGIEFVPDSFVRSPVEPGAVLYALEGDFGFSVPNATDPAHEIGHEVKLINFSKPGQPLTLQIADFAHNNTFDQAFVSGIHGWNRPTNIRMGPDGCAWVVDYGAVRDFGQGGADSKFVGAGNGPLVQIPGTGVIFRICPQ
jgi:glucose/arabinose dehydrogenase